jgi:hypothetical protein
LSAGELFVMSYKMEVINISWPLVNQENYFIDQS